VGLYQRAFKDDPSQADDFRERHRFAAAVSAVRAAEGKGRDGAALTAGQRAAFRAQALDWLRADLDALIRRLGRATPKDRDRIVGELRRWVTRPALAGVRDRAILARLPEPERDACRRLWADVEQAIRKTEKP
jgi:hypothetical protein